MSVLFVVMALVSDAVGPMARPTEARFDEPSGWALERLPRESLRACLERTLRDAISEGCHAGVELPASRHMAAQLASRVGSPATPTPSWRPRAICT